MQRIWLMKMEVRSKCPSWKRDCLTIISFLVKLSITSIFSTKISYNLYVTYNMWCCKFDIELEWALNKLLLSFRLCNWPQHTTPQHLAFVWNHLHLWFYFSSTVSSKFKFNLFPKIWIYFKRRWSLLDCSLHRWWYIFVQTQTWKSDLNIYC